MSPVKVRKVGNSLGVVLTKEMLDRLKVSEGDQLFLTEAPDGSLRLTPYDPEFEDQMAIAEEGGRAYRHTLKKLAE